MILFCIGTFLFALVISLLALYIEDDLELHVGDYVYFYHDYEMDFRTYEVESKYGYITKITKNSVGWDIYHVTLEDDSIVKFDWVNKNNVSKRRDPRKSKNYPLEKNKIKPKPETSYATTIGFDLSWLSKLFGRKEPND